MKKAHKIRIYPNSRQEIQFQKTFGCVRFYWNFLLDQRITNDKMKKENPDKKFYVAYDRAVCPNMKLTTLEKVYNALKEEKNVVEVPEAVAKKAKSSLERMFKVKS